MRDNFSLKFAEKAFTRNGIKKNKRNPLGKNLSCAMCVGGDSASLVS